MLGPLIRKGLIMVAAAAKSERHERKASTVRMHTSVLWSQREILVNLVRSVCPDGTLLTGPPPSETCSSRAPRGILVDGTVMAVVMAV